MQKAQGVIMDYFKLTKTQKRVLRLIFCGFDDYEIAKKLCVSPVTIKTHTRDIYQIFGIFGLNRRAKLVIKLLLKFGIDTSKLDVNNL